MKIKDLDRTVYYSFDNQEIAPGFSGAVLKSLYNDTCSFTDEFRDWLFAYQDGMCAYCGSHLGKDWSGNKNANIEHIKNKRRKGDHLPPNIVYACAKCNGQKGASHYSSMYVKLAMRQNDVLGIMNFNQALMLMEKNCLGFEVVPYLYFELMDWKHIQLPEPEPEDHYDRIMQRVNVVRANHSIEEARNLRAKAKEGEV